MPSNQRKKEIKEEKSKKKKNYTIWQGTQHTLNNEFQDEEKIN